MDLVSFSTIGAMVGTLTMVLVYSYLYFMYRERYIFLWAVGWSVLFLRIVFFDSGIVNWKQSILGFTVYQLLFIGCSLVYVWGTYVFIEKPFNKWWTYGAAGASALSILFCLSNVPLLYKVIPPAWFAGIALMWIGIAFFCYLELTTGIGKYITVSAFILWSILTITLPFIIIEPYYAFVVITGGILKLIVVVGTLLVYFEKTRRDLFIKETQYRLFAENAVDIIFRYKLRPVAKFDYISASASAVTGYSPDEYYADPRLFFNSIHPEDAPLVNNYFSAFDHPQELPLAFRFTHRNQKIVWVEQKCILIYNKANQVYAIEGIIRDVTARKQLEQITSWYDRMNMVGYMAATVAHEIRNPMTTVHGYLQLIKRKEKYQDDKDIFQLMIGELDRANTIIREYLSLSRQRVANLKTCSLNNIIETLFPLIQADAISSKVHVQLDLTNIPELSLDEYEIRQLLLNFVRNGIEAMPKGGSLIVRTFQDDSHVVLSISDQGPGIPAQVLEKLGTPFTTTKDTGTGLGLPLCYQIAHRHHAEIDVATNNQGTTFFIHFNPPQPTI